MAESLEYAGPELSRKSNRGLIGLFAAALAGTVLTAEVAAVALGAMRSKYADLADAFSWFIFDFGVPLLVLTLILIVIAIIRGDRDRRRGFIALVIVALVLGSWFFA